MDSVILPLALACSFCHLDSAVQPDIETVKLRSCRTILIWRRHLRVQRVPDRPTVSTRPCPPAARRVVVRAFPSPSSSHGYVLLLTETHRLPNLRKINKRTGSSLAHPDIAESNDTDPRSSEHSTR